MSLDCKIPSPSKNAARVLLDKKSAGVSHISYRQAYKTSMERIGSDWYKISSPKKLLLFLLVDPPNHDDQNDDDDEDCFVESNSCCCFKIISKIKKLRSP